MSYRYLPTICLLSFLLTILFGCEKDITTVPPESQRAYIYFNSFEYPTDIIGWQGYGMRIYNDAPSIGGKRSLFISGACMVPHAWIDFQNKSLSSYFNLRCWGKSLLRSGHVNLRQKNDYLKSVQIYISDSSWTSYKSDGSLFCAYNDTLRLELISGGFVPDSMLVDLIEIVPVK